MLVYTHFITRPFRILPRRTSEITRTYYNISSVSIIFDREILPFETNTKNYCQSFHPDPCFHPPPPYSYAVFASSSSYFSTPATFVKIPGNRKGIAIGNGPRYDRRPRLCILPFFGSFIKIARVTTLPLTLNFFYNFLVVSWPPLPTLGTVGPTTPDPCSPYE